jgi:hypothetical protein
MAQFRYMRRLLKITVSLSIPLTPNDVPSSLLAPMRRGVCMNFPAAESVLG